MFIFIRNIEIHKEFPRSSVCEGLNIQEEMQFNIDTDCIKQEFCIFE